MGGLYACGATFRYTVPLPNIFLTRLFSKTRLKKKDFQEIAPLAWAQEVSGSNPDALTTNLLTWLTFPPNPARPRLYPSARGNANIVPRNIVVATIIVVTHLTQVRDGTYKHTGHHHPRRPVGEGLNHLPPARIECVPQKEEKLCHSDL